MHPSNVHTLCSLREISGNKTCGDCGDSNPGWCSINTGILICLLCSGGHRSLGY